MLARRQCQNCRRTPLGVEHHTRQGLTLVRNHYRAMRRLSILAGHPQRQRSLRMPIQVLVSAVTVVSVPPRVGSRQPSPATPVPTQSRKQLQPQAAAINPVTSTCSKSQENCNMPRRRPGESKWKVPRPPSECASVHCIWPRLGPATGRQRRAASSSFHTVLDAQPNEKQP